MDVDATVETVDGSEEDCVCVDVPDDVGNFVTDRSVDDIADVVPVDAVDAVDALDGIALEVAASLVSETCGVITPSSEPIRCSKLVAGTRTMSSVGVGRGRIVVSVELAADESAVLFVDFGVVDSANIADVTDACCEPELADVSTTFGRLDVDGETIADRVTLPASGLGFVDTVVAFF